VTAKDAPTARRALRATARCMPARRVMLQASLLAGIASLLPRGAVGRSAPKEGNDMSNVESRNKALVRDRFEAWAQGTGSPFELLNDDATWTVVGRSLVAKTYPNKEAFMREVIRPFNARVIAGLQPTVHAILADGDCVAAYFDAATTARDGKPYANTYFWIFEMKGERVVKATALFDTIEFNDLWSRVQPA
jgi:ketosteroid isomerase-like protein